MLLRNHIFENSPTKRRLMNNLNISIIIYVIFILYVIKVQLIDTKRYLYNTSGIKIGYLKFFSNSLSKKVFFNTNKLIIEETTYSPFERKAYVYHSIGGQEINHKDIIYFEGSSEKIDTIFRCKCTPKGKIIDDQWIVFTSVNNTEKMPVKYNQRMEELWLERSLSIKPIEYKI